MKLLEREGKLIDALREAIELQNGIHEISDWLTDAETHLSLSHTVCRLPDSLRKQLTDHTVFNVCFFIKFYLTLFKLFRIF